MTPDDLSHRKGIYAGLPTYPDDWKESPLGDLVDTNPEALGSGTPGDFAFRYIDLSSVNEGVTNWDSVQETTFRSAPSRARRCVREHDVLFGTVRPSLQSHTAIGVVEGSPLVASTGFAVLRAGKKSCPGYIKHLIFSEQVAAQVRRLETGSNYPAVNESDLKKVLVPHPEGGEQTRIAEVLDTLDKAISDTQAEVDKKELVFQGHQQQFFTPSAVRAREEWLVTRLDDLAESITSGPRGWASYYANEGDFFLRIGNLTRKHLDLRFDDVVKVKPPIGAEGVRTALAPGDLLISITADLGIIGVVPDWMGVAYINQHIARARLDRTRVNPRFLGYQLSGLIGQKQFYRLNDVGAKAGLNLPTVGGLKAWLPPLAEQDRIASILDSLQQALRHEEALLSKLQSLKTGLSSDLLTGRVRVTTGAPE